MQIFVERLNALLKENGVSKYRLAKYVGVTNSTVILWCEGINEPKISKLKKIAEFFEVSTDYLVGLEDRNGTKTR